jgi:S-(hydroxymethyl)mycothiol dehydrogenase
MKIAGMVVRTPGAPSTMEELTLDPPGPGEVLVRLIASGVCHSDLHAKLGNFGAEFPYLLGHEATGVVEEVGHGVERPTVGETVILNWRAPCGRCRYCAAGNPTCCAKPVDAKARTRTADGKTLGRILGLSTFCTHTVVAAGQAVPVAAELSPAATALIGCGVATGVGAALNTARVRPGSTVAVYGCGAVGISVIQGARLSQAARIFAVDLVAKKLEWARSLGATDLIDPAAGDPAKQIRSATGGGVQYAFEAVGLPQTAVQAIQSCEPGGECVLIGVPNPKAELTLPLARFFFSRVTVRSSHYGDCLPARDFPVYADLYRKGSLQLDALVTQRIALSELDAAYAAMQAGEVLRSVVIF